MAKTLFWLHFGMAPIHTGQNEEPPDNCLSEAAVAVAAAPKEGGQAGVSAVYGGLVFLSAFLLFLVEPMAAKRLLPILGGSSSVWVTCLVFFQATLLVGYLYAHWLARKGSLWVHGVLLGCAVVGLALPAAMGIVLGARGIDIHPGLPVSESPVATIFLMLGTSIGLPFLVLSSTSPLLQVWWARRAGGAVPYRLFALSNAGSLLALLAYPALVEPNMTLAAQRGWWFAGFVVYAVACGWLAKQAMRGRAGTGPTHCDETTINGVSTAPKAPARTRWLWFLLPMGAAMQLSAVTSHLSQDIAAIPLLWILPLAAYLLTFILAFEKPNLYRRWAVTRMMVVMLASLGYALSSIDTRLPVGLAVLFYLLELFVAAWFCHAEAYRLRPSDARESTVFYLLVAAGGVAGTFLVGIAFPNIFRSNYDLALAFVATAALAAVVTWSEGWAQRALWCTGTLLLLVLTVALNIEFGKHALMRARNFYGSLRVIQTDFDYQASREGTRPDGTSFAGTGPIRVLMNGRIRHGMQVMQPDRMTIPTTYYGTDSGVGLALRYCCEGRTKRVGVVGLGAGTLAAYGQPGDVFRFYEINPLVEPIARNLFTYLRDSPAAITIVPGDGRTSLASETPQHFDVLVVDAFSGDAIPLHLLTRQALELYRRHLAPGGIVAFHVSNSYLDLAPEIALLADSEGMQARLVESFDVPAEGAYRATWVLVTEDGSFFDKPGVESSVAEITRRPGLRLWTDDYSSLLPVLRLGQ